MVKKAESPMTLLHRCCFSKLAHEAEDIALSLQNANLNIYGMLESRVWTGAERNVFQPQDVHFSCVESKALLAQPLGDDERDSESAVLLHPNNCLIVLWKRLGSRHKWKFAKYSSARSAVRIEALSVMAASTVAEKIRALPESVASFEEDVFCGKFCRPLLSAPWRCFSSKEIMDATKNFHPGNLVGRGGFARVYRGSLPCGRMIAIKKFNQSDLVKHREKEFLVEIGIMAHVCHPNTTPLVGFCLEGGLYLIYDFCPNGSLAGMLHGPKLIAFDWDSRYKVAMGTAQGLVYLHEQCRRRIIHRDIKASNILLDGDLEPHISDFGLAKWLPNEWSHHSVRTVKGTFGYLAPEYQMHGIVDEKTDVYSFGVLLLEIITGRSPVDGDQQCLVLWARPLLESERIQELSDPELRGCYNHKQMHCMILTAEMCIRQSSLSRPTMSQVLQLLGAKESSRL